MTSRLKFIWVTKVAVALSAVAISFAAATIRPALAATPIDKIVAIVDDDVVMQSEFDRFRTRITQQMSQHGGQLPPEDILNRQILERLVMSRIQLQYAKRAGVTVDDDTLNKAVANIAAQNKLSIDQFRQEIEKQGYDFAQFREDIRNEIIVGRLKQKEVDNHITVSDREIDSYLQNPRNKGSTGDTEYHLSHILVGTPEGASSEQIAEAQKKATAVLEQLRGGTDFGKVAASSSDSREALEGGDLGWRKAGEMPTVLGDALRNMKPGDISDIMRGPNGFHIIKLIEVRAGSDAGSITQTHARHILIKTSEAVSQDEARTKLEKLKARLDGGEDFAALARSHSEDRGSAAGGGDLGWTNPGQMDPDFQREMDALQPGQTSQPFQTQFGWHIVQVLERRQHDDSAEAERNKAREAIRQRKTEEEFQAWMRRLRDEAYVEYRMPGVAESKPEPTSDDTAAAEAEVKERAPAAEPNSTTEPAATSPDASSESAPTTQEPAPANEPPTLPDDTNASEPTTPSAGDAAAKPTEPDSGDSPYVIDNPSAQ
ncbi:MAG: peptidylprolyl isomerase [Gammaproteobacteria bacterium]